MAKRMKTNYPGVFYREAQRIGGRGQEKVFYVVFKKAGKVYEEKAGRQYADDMTPSRAAGIRAQRIEGKRASRKELRQQREAEKAPGAKIWTIGRLWTEYKDNHPDLKGLVYDENRFKNYIKPSFENKEPKTLVVLDIDRIRINLLKTKSPGTVKNILELLRRIINYGIKKNLCEGPGFEIKIPKVNNLKTEDLSPGQLKRLLKAIAEDTHEQAGPIMLMALYTGMRRGEMFKLKWSDVDFQRGFIHIREPKGGVDQQIPLNDAARELLQNHIRTGSDYVFPGRGGNQRVDINKQVNAIKKKADLPKDFRPLHGLRHFFATMLADSGEVTMHTLQKLLTHKDERMTLRYTHFRDKALKKASNVAGDIIQKAMNGKVKVVK